MSHILRSLLYVKHTGLKQFRKMDPKTVSSISTANKNCKLDDLTKEELIERVRKLEANVDQLKNILVKEKQTNYKQRGDELFDFSRFKKRHVFLKLLYLGWEYHGFAGQEPFVKTIENELITALKRTKLLESVETGNYSRCGRTDAGVSAFSQVISVDLRTNLNEGRGVFTTGNYNPYRKSDLEYCVREKELPYCQMLNRVLPKDIKVLAWSPVTCEANARFHCKTRTYKYYFVKRDLDLQKMEEAASYFIGEHDFRNLCKMNVKNSVTNYRRTILEVSISSVFSNSEDRYQVCELTIKGHAFLWHQIRCMVAVLFLVGQGKESAQVIKELLDIEKNPRKPQYNMALDIPLVLFDCEYEDVEWQYDTDVIKKTISELYSLWTQNIIKGTVIRKMFESLEDKSDTPLSYDDQYLLTTARSKAYRPLLERHTGETLEEKMANLAKKRKIDVSGEESNCDKLLI